MVTVGAMRLAEKIANVMTRVSGFINSAARAFMTARIWSSVGIVGFGIWAGVRTRYLAERASRP